MALGWRGNPTTRSMFQIRWVFTKRRRAFTHPLTMQVGFVCIDPRVVRLAFWSLLHLLAVRCRLVRSHQLPCLQAVLRFVLKADTVSCVARLAKMISYQLEDDPPPLLYRHASVGGNQLPPKIDPKFPIASYQCVVAYERYWDLRIYQRSK